MLMRTDPFREFDRLTQQVFGTAARPSAMPIDAYRKGNAFYVHFDLPGVDPASIDLTVEQNVLAVKAERPSIAADGAEMIVSERPAGTFTRQLFLGETLDADHIEADYNAGVLTLTIPVMEAAKPRKLAITTHEDNKQLARQRRHLSRSSAFEPAGGRPARPSGVRPGRPGSLARMCLDRSVGDERARFRVSKTCGAR